MAIDITASAGVFDEAAEPLVMRLVFDALLAAIDATDDERASSVMGVMLHVVPASRVAQIAARTVVRIVHSVDGGWGIGGHAFTNDEIDERPE